MTCRGKLALPLLGLALALGACDSPDPTEPIAASDPIAALPAEPVVASFSSSFRGGIPIGMYHQPSSTMGDEYNGALRNIMPKQLKEELAGIKSRGGRVMLTFTGSHRHFVTSQGHLDIDKWKARVDRYKNVDFSSYINDGTVIGHFLLDEPNDPDNWNGKLVTGAELEEMAKHSKKLWPNLPTVVRTAPDYLGRWSKKYDYVDAAWAQYLHRRGDVDDYIRRSVADAKANGLALVVGLNILKGGNPAGRNMTASQLESWGSALLDASYACAFLSWEYEARYVQQADIQRVMQKLADKALSHPVRSCRGSNGQTSGSTPPLDLPSPPPPPEPPAPPEPEPPAPPEPEPPAPPEPEPPVPPEPPAPAEPAGIQLNLSGPIVKNKRQYLLLTWSGAAGASVDLYRDGEVRRSVKNKGRTMVIVNPKRKNPFTFRICERGSSKCSTRLSFSFK